MPKQRSTADTASGGSKTPCDETSHRLSRRQVIQGAALLGGGLMAGSSGFIGAVAAETGKPGVQYSFPENFLWGAGTAGLQHEGSPLADGARPSSMYRWAHAPQKHKVATPDWFTPPVGTFDITADQYHRFPSDIELMRKLNLNAYNFEIYWPRVLPEGSGRVNQAGLAFYDRLVDSFLKAGITPLCNLYVFDHPAALQDRGGWLNRDMAQWYADYAKIMFDRLGDRVKYWTTICEIPIVHAFTSGAITPAPSQQSADLRAMHNLLLGQGSAVQAFRASSATGQIGNQHNWIHVRPASNEQEDVAAAQRTHAYSNLLLLDSQLRGEYPKELIEWYGATWPTDAIKSGDLATIAAPIDFIGLDYYHNETVRYDPSEEGGALKTRSVGHEGTAEGMYQTLMSVRKRYGNRPLFILEIGQAVKDTVVNGEVNDPGRISYLRDLLTGAHRALKEGVDLRSCFIWSFVDGWEFGHGLTRRYGLVYVDPKTQKRIVKASGYWYRDLIAAHGFDVPDTVGARHTRGAPSVIKIRTGEADIEM